MLFIINSFVKKRVLNSFRTFTECQRSLKPRVLMYWLLPVGLVH